MSRLVLLKPVSKTQPSPLTTLNPTEVTKSQPTHRGKSARATQARQQREQSLLCFFNFGFLEEQANCSVNFFSLLRLWYQALISAFLAIRQAGLDMGMWHKQMTLSIA